MIEQAKNAAPELPRNRLIAGVIVFVIGHAAPLAIPLVMASSLSTSWKTGLSGLMVFGIPELGTLLTVVVLGKAGFNAVKSRVFGWIGRTVLPSEVSRPRYYTGLILFLIPFFVAWISPYLFEVVPNLSEHQLIIAISGDLALITGLCLMGGQAWDKLRSLFIYDSRVVFSSAATKEPG